MPEIKQSAPIGWVENLPVGTVLALTSESGRPVVAIKLGNKQSHGGDQWHATNGKILTAFNVSMSTTEPVILTTSPGVVTTAQGVVSGRSGVIGLMTTWWTGTTWLPFVESDRGDITGPGHQDKAAFAAQVTAYDEDCGGEPLNESFKTTADDVDHRWVTLVVGEDGDWSATTVTKDTPFATPVTTVWGKR